MAISYGYDPDRDQWSVDATTRLLTPIAMQIIGASGLVFAREAGMDKIDKDYGTDAMLMMPERTYALAIRIRSHSDYVAFGDLTLRYDSLQTPGKLLELKKSVANLCFYGWCDTDFPKPATDLVDWHLINFQRMLDLYGEGRLPYSGPFLNKDKSSRLIGIEISVLRSNDLIKLEKQPRPVRPKSTRGEENDARWKYLMGEDT